MANIKSDVTIIGGGIVGLSTAYALRQACPDINITLIEKEATVAVHQTGHNSGVIHTGIYNKPGSLKAALATAGCASIKQFCSEYGIPEKTTGKLIVATQHHEIETLHGLLEQGLKNNVPVRLITPQEAHDHEPYVECLKALWVESTGVVDYTQVCQTLLRLIQEMGVSVLFNSPAKQALAMNDGTIIETPDDVIFSRWTINCAGLQSDRVTQMFGLKRVARIIPFRGEYYELTLDAANKVKGLIYPVPNPKFPFLGVHFTRNIHGHVHAGPNAVLGLSREGYGKLSCSLKDTLDTLTYPGFWKLAAKHYDEGMQEILRSVSKKRFLESLRRMIPDLSEHDLKPSPAGIRAQAVTPEGNLADDFLILKAHGMLHVCNAPSPAATASLEIGKEVVKRLMAASDNLKH